MLQGSAALPAPRASPHRSFRSGGSYEDLQKNEKKKNKKIKVWRLHAPNNSGFSQQKPLTNSGCI